MQLPDIGDLIPHRGSSIMLDLVVEFRPEGAVCTYEIRPGHLYEAGGSVPGAAVLEMMAQAAAVHLGLSERARGDGGSSNAKAGYVIAVRGFRVHEGALVTGTALRIGANLTRHDRKSALFDCWVDCDGRRVAQAALTVHRP